MCARDACSPLEYENRDTVSVGADRADTVSGGADGGADAGKEAEGAGIVQDSYVSGYPFKVNGEDGVSSHPISAVSSSISAASAG